ncbi:hypothetical protein [Natronolimnobius baerhuensis]|uniref:DUF8147 domain-containing protein n=1 Tax=Natronolimnobius baerhuensis TaxID=253108 RepID=A0A202ED28_9EURY|nr:hypothetical protein [Natronolimnobius baerhuensis]OVE86139.1 hypothetical protein B2G88_04940 [Natronolimnobius baerhuensis]
MSAKAGAFALIAGLVTFFGVGLTVTGLTEHWVNYSLLLGLFAGTAASLAVTTSVSVVLGEDVPAQKRRIAGIIAGFGGGLVVGLLGAAWLEGIGPVASMGIGFATGCLVAVGVGLIDPFGSDTPRESTDDDRDARD